MNNRSWLGVIAAALVLCGIALSVRSCRGGDEPVVSSTTTEATTTLPAGQVVGNYLVDGRADIAMLGTAIEVRPVTGEARIVELDDSGQGLVAERVKDVAVALSDSPVGDGGDCQAGELRALSASVDGLSVVVPKIGGVGVCDEVFRALGALELTLLALAGGTDSTA
jgi:hypothetical protein